LIGAAFGAAAFAVHRFALMGRHSGVWALPPLCSSRMHDDALWHGPACRRRCVLFGRCAGVSAAAVLVLLALGSATGLLDRLIDLHLFHKAHDSWSSAPYEYYGRAATTRRLLGHAHDLTRDNHAACTFPHFNITIGDIGPVLTAELTSQQDQGPPPTVTTVYVVRHQTVMLLEWIWFSVLGDGMHADPEPDGDGDGDVPPRAAAAVVDGIDPVTGAPSKLFPAHGLRFVLVDYDLRLLSRAGTSVRRVILIAEASLREAIADIDAALPDRAPREAVRFGVLLIGTESCAGAPHPLSTAVDPLQLQRVRYAFVTYGECTQLDNDRVRLWPLGPDTNALVAMRQEAARTGTFAAVQAPARPPAMTERRIDLNMIGSYREAKPTRVQAIMAMTDVCNGPSSAPPLRCERYTGLAHLAFSASGSIDRALGINRLQPAVADLFGGYTDILRDSRLTLSPAGSTAECGRTWEALVFGSIPVVEHWREGGASPLYPNFRCLPADHHAFLRDEADPAPVLWVDDWRRDLPPIVQAMRDDPAALEQRQRALSRWYRRLLRHLHRLWMASARKYLTSDD
jgi:hypothetical protein